MAPLRQFANHPDPMDLWLESQGYYRKITAKDGSSLFRAIAEQIYHTQRYHMEVRQQCIDYLRHHPSIFMGFKLEESIDEYLENLLNPTQWGGPVEIVAFSSLYKVNILVFKEVAVHPRIENQEYNRTIMLCSSPDRHYDSIYHKEYSKVAGFCQSVVYEVLYKDVFKMKDVSYAVEKMLHYKLMRHRSDVGLCTPRKFLNFNCSSVQLKGKGMDETPDSEVNVRELLNKGITPFPYKVAKSLDPNIFRNVEFDVWVDFRRGLRFGYFDSTSELRVGVKCLVKLSDGGSYVGHIQEMADDKGPVVLFVEEFGEKRTVSYECLEVLPQESPPAKQWPFSFHGQKFSSTSKQASSLCEQGGKGRKVRDGSDSKSGGGGSSRNVQSVGARSRNRKMSHSNAVCDGLEGSEVSPQQGTSLITYSAATSPNSYHPYSGYQVETDVSTGIPLVVDRSVQFPILPPTPTTPLSRQSPLLVPLSPSTGTDDMACMYAPYTFASDPKDSSRLDVTSSNGPICPTDYFHFVPYDFVETPSEFSEGLEPESASAQSSTDYNLNYMSNDQWKSQSLINFNAPKSVLEDGADLPMSDIQTLRFFYNLGNDVYRAQCLSWNSPPSCNLGCATSCGPSRNVVSGSSDYSEKNGRITSSDSTINSQDSTSATAGSRRKRRDTTASSPGGVSMSSDSETGVFVPRIANAAPSPSSSQSQSHLPPRFKRDGKSGGKPKSKDCRAEDVPASVPTSTSSAPSLSSKRIGDSSIRLEPLVLNDPSAKDPVDGAMSPAVTVPYGYVCYPNMPFSPVLSDPSVPLFPSCRVQYSDFVSDGRPQCYSPVNDVASQYPVYAQSSHFIFPASPGIYVGTPTWTTMTPPTPQ